MGGPELEPGKGDAAGGPAEALQMFCVETSPVDIARKITALGVAARELRIADFTAFHAEADEVDDMARQLTDILREKGFGKLVPKPPSVRGAKEVSHILKR